MAVQANELSPSLIQNWLIPNTGQEPPTRIYADQLGAMCVQVTSDGYSNQVTLQHNMNLTAADLTAGYPLVEIYNPATNPIPASTGATHTTLTGAPALLGVTVLSSLSSQLILAFSSPAAAPGAVFQVLISRNPASSIPA